MQVQAALLLDANTPFVIDELTLSPPQAGEVLVRMVASGVCHSDWHLVTGATKHPMPVIPGHEGAGIVEAVGAEVSRVQPGDHVILNWAPDCGQCFYCQRGQFNLCDTYLRAVWAGTMLDGTCRFEYGGQPVRQFTSLGAFATHTVVPQESCVPIRTDVPLTRAALVGCAVATGVGSALYTADVQPGDRIVVFGCGGVGLNVLQGAVLGGATTLIAVDANPAKEALAKQFGATHFLTAGEHVRKEILMLTEGRGADFVFEAIGIPQVQEAALRVVRPGGGLILVGFSPVKEPTNLSAAFIARQGKTVKGSYYGNVNTGRDFPLLLDLYMSKRLNLDDLVSRTYQLSEINEAYAAMLSGEVARGVIVFDEAEAGGV